MQPGTLTGSPNEPVNAQIIHLTTMQRSIVFGMNINVAK
jgi:hypothetical protein